MRAFARPRLARSRFATTLLAAMLALGLLAPSAAAQDGTLEANAPAGTLLAVGVRPQESPIDELGRALDELDWDGARQGYEALTTALGGADLTDMLPFPARGMLGPLGSGAPDLPGGDEVRAGLDAICPGTADVLADTGWHDADDVLVSLGMSRARPVPAALIQVRAGEEAQGTLNALMDRLAECAEGEPMRQGGHDIVVLEGGDMPLAASRVEDLLLLANDPAAVRGAIRRLGGADEPTFADGGAGEDLATFEERGLRVALNTKAIADLAEGFLPGGDTAPPAATVARERGLAALRTFGGLSLRLSLESEGLSREIVVSVDPAGGDEELAGLLRCDDCRAPGPFLVPRDAVSVTGTSFPLRGWVRYLDGWFSDLAEAGAPVPPDLGTAAQSVGVDLDAALLDWIGQDVESARLQAISPDLRRLIYSTASLTSVTVRSEEAAERGLEALVDGLTNLATQVEDDDFAAFADQIAVRERSYQGTSYRRIQFGPASDLALGVVANRMILAFPSETMHVAIDLARGETENAFADEAHTDLREAAPEDLTSWSYARPGEDLTGLADTLDVFVQPLAFAVATGIEAAGDEEAQPVQAPQFGAGGVELAPAAPQDADFDPSGVTPAPLDVPGSLEAELGNGAAPTIEVQNRQAQIYRLEGLTPGEPVQVEMTSDPVDTYLYLLDPATGAVLDSNDDEPDTSRSALAFTAPEDGEVWIGASSFFSSGSGPYTLTTLVGEDVDPSLMRDLDQGDAFASGPFDPDAIEPETLSVPGEVQASLGDDDPTVDGRGARVYRLDGFEEGDVLTVEMTAEDIDTYLYLLDPAAPAVRASNDDAGGLRRSELRFRAPEAGTDVWVAASSFGGSESGPFTLRVSREGDEEEEEEPTVVLADLLPAFEIVPDVVRTVGEHLGIATGWTATVGDEVRSVQTWQIDW